MKIIYKILCLIPVLILNSNAQVSLEIGSGSRFEINNTLNLDLSGNWTNMGYFYPGKSQITFNGSSNQVVDGNEEERFFCLKLIKPKGILKVHNDITILSRLELLKGNIFSENNIITIEEDGTTRCNSGYIIGKLRKKFNSPGTKNFEIGTINGYTPVEVKVTSGTGELIMASFEGSHIKVNGTSVLQRYWSIESSGIKKTDLKFHYLPQDVSGIEGDYIVGDFYEKWFFPQSKINLTAHTASVLGIDPNGDWTLGKRDALYPSQIALNFTTNSNKIQLSWYIPIDLQNYDFTLERADYWLKDWKTIANSDEITKGSIGNSQYIDSPPAGRYLYRLKQAGNADNDIQYSNEIEVAVELPGTFTLEQNYPNPFNSDTKIAYSIPIDVKVKIVIFNLTGQTIAEPVNEYQSAGKHIISFDASNLASGTYLYKITAGSFMQTRKMILLR